MLGRLNIYTLVSPLLTSDICKETSRAYSDKPTQQKTIAFPLFCKKFAKGKKRQSSFYSTAEYSRKK